MQGPQCCGGRVPELLGERVKPAGAQGMRERHAWQRVSAAGLGSDGARPAPLGSLGQSLPAVFTRSGSAQQGLGPGDALAVLAATPHCTQATPRGHVLGLRADLPKTRPAPPSSPLGRPRLALSSGLQRHPAQRPHAELPRTETCLRVRRPPVLPCGSQPRCGRGSPRFSHLQPFLSSQ